MKYMGDKHWWDDRFENRTLKIMNHEKILEEDIKYFPLGGKILDLASGDGRNSIYLASLGYEMTAIDFSQEALNRLSYFADKEDLKIKTKLADLSNLNMDYDLGKFEAIIINHYRLNPKLYKELTKHLEDGGILWVNGFREVPKDNVNITKDDIFTESDFNNMDGLECIDKKLYEAGDRKFIRVIYTRSYRGV